jgi:uncharacterized membrane protein YcaP (DUF421 family)
MQIVLRAAVLFFFILLVIRALGRKELAQISSFELLLLIVMGDLIQQGVTGDDRSVTGAMLAVATMALLVLSISYLSFRSSRVRSLSEGTPVLIIKDGKPISEVIEIERLTLDEVKDAAREQGIRDLADVDLGVLEADGTFSFVTKNRTRPPANLDDRAT